jgi:hypothetical protein
VSCHHAPSAIALVAGALVHAVLLAMVAFEGAVHAALHSRRLPHTDGLAIGASSTQQVAADLHGAVPAATPLAPWERHRRAISVPWLTPPLRPIRGACPCPSRLVSCPRNSLTARTRRGRGRSPRDRGFSGLSKREPSASSPVRTGATACEVARPGESAPGLARWLVNGRPGQDTREVPPGRPDPLPGQGNARECRASASAEGVSTC